MHSAICERCAGQGWHWTMRAGVVFRRNPRRTVTVQHKQRCTSCAGAGRNPTPGETLSGLRLPAI
jgi:hypothetical protein